MSALPAIRQAGPEDASALSALGVSTFSETFGRLYRPEDLAAFLRDHHSVDYYARFLSDPEAACWVMEEDRGTLVGYCTCAPCTLPAPDMPPESGELCRLYISEGAQGVGLGKTFMDIALRWLEARFDHLYVGVYSENIRAQKLYQRYGFEKVAEYHFMVGSHPDLEWVMKRRA
ncbi:MAG: GNAT family N-acetyltransferase [Pseudomonadota bacterium]